MLNEQVIPIDFGMGIETKSDPKMVVAGKLLRLENAIFTNVKKLTKRNGYVALGNTVAGIGTLVAPQMVHSYNAELLCADQNLLLSYSPSQDSWISKGPYISTEIYKSNIDQDHPTSGYVDSAILGNYAIYGHSTASELLGPLSFVYGSVIDMQSGIELIAPLNLSGVVGLSGGIPNPVRVVNLGNTTLAILYLDPTGTEILIRTVSFSGGTAHFSGESIVSTAYAGSNFDVITTATGAALFYYSTGGLTLEILDTTGAVVDTAIITDANANPGPPINPLFVSTTSNGNVWVYWTDVTLSGTTPTVRALKYAVYNSTLSVNIVPQTFITFFDAAPHVISNFTSYSNDASHQTVFWGVLTATGPTTYVDQTYSTEVNDTGTPASPGTIFANGITPMSHSFDIIENGITNSYAIFLFRGDSLSATGRNLPQLQPTLFVVQLTNIPSTGIPYVVARFEYGIAPSQINTGDGAEIGYTPNVTLLSATKVAFGTAIETQEFNPLFEEMVAAVAYTLDFNSANAYRAVESGQISVLNGAVTQMYDGVSATEFNYNLTPELTALLPSGGSGSILAGTYQYLAIFNWLDANGNLYQSDISNVLSITLTGNKDIEILVSTNYLSQKIGGWIAIYRTQSLGSTFYLVTDPVFVQSSDASAFAFITFTDDLVDGALPGRPIAYTYPASPVLGNGTPPPSMIMLAHNNRLWLVDSENPNTTWYTKSFEPGIGLSPSALMTETIDPKYGNITALAEMDDKLITFKQNGLFVQSGDGVDDTGAGSTLSFPQIVNSDVGCSVLKSVVLTPTGVFFKSANGLYMIDRALGVTYKGMEVEQYNNEVITSAILVSGKSQIRFLVSSGLTLVYDYIFGQWSTFTNHTGLGADDWQGTYVYATSAGQIFKEVSGLYTDNGTDFALLLQTSWLGLAGVQGFERVRRLIMLGDYANGLSASHLIQIQAAYDFNSSFSTPISYQFGNASTSSFFQYRERLPRQKCDTISLLIQEVVTGSGLEYLDLNNISFEAGMKKGVNKMASTQSVG